MASQTDVKTETVQKAAERIAQVRHTWGWKFQQKNPKVMALDVLMAEAALSDLSLDEITAKALSTPLPKPNIIAHEEWTALLGERDRLQAQIARYRLPSQRGAKKRAEEAFYEHTRKIRAVDGVIGIDA